MQLRFYSVVSAAGSVPVAFADNTVSVRVRYDTTACPSGFCLPECVAYAVGSSGAWKWSNAGVKTTVSSPRDGFVTCHLAAGAYVSVAAIDAALPPVLYSISTATDGSGCVALSDQQGVGR
jgi:hypothetical protein